MSTAVATTPVKQPINFGSTGVQLNTLEDAFRFSNAVAASGWAPKGMEKPESILIALQHAAELGLPPLAGLQNLAVINGRPGIFGDAALAIVRKSGLLESYKEEEVGTRGKDDWGVRITVKRINEDPHSDSFTVADAKTANLWGKQGPWSNYPKRMLKFRARGFVLRDIFGDVLKGLHTVEELRDTPPEKNVTPSGAGLAALMTAPATTPPATNTGDPILGRDDIISEIQNYMLDSGVSEGALEKEIGAANVVSEELKELALFELPAAELEKVLAYLRTKSAPAASTSKGA
jgi:hypothetical protein